MYLKSFPETEQKQQRRLCPNCRLSFNTSLKKTCELILNNENLNLALFYTGSA
jgi:hypothetical protein